jgi:hypothetical protein
MSIKEKIISRLLETKTIKNKLDLAVNKAVSSAKKEWAEETTKVLKDIQAEKIEKRKYVTSSQHQKPQEFFAK